MVEKSRELKDASSGKPVYDLFFVGDLIEVMRDATGKGVDAIVAADVFVYFGTYHGRTGTTAPLHGRAQ